MAQIALKANPETTVVLLRAMLNYIISYNLADNDFIRLRTTGFEAFAREIRRYRFEDIVDVLWTKPSKIIEIIHLYLRAKRPVIIIDAEKITPSELTLINDLALTTGNVGLDATGIIVLRSPGNAQGLIDMGVNPHYLPGQQAIADATTRQKFEAAWHRPLPLKPGRDAIGIIEGLEKGEIQGILVVGTDAVGKIGNAIFEIPLLSVLIDTVLSETPPYADVILPGITLAETGGTFTNCERRIQYLHRTISPPCGKENWQIISALATALGYPMDYPSVSSIFAEIASLAPIYEAGIYGEQWPFLGKSKFKFEDGLARFRQGEILAHVPDYRGVGGVL